MSEIWTPVARQVETVQIPPVRVFDRTVFDNFPIFDTGTATGVWTETTEQTDIWTEV